jgi:opacity protein-like surface antigen
MIRKTRTLSLFLTAIIALPLLSSHAFGADLEKGQIEATGLVGIVTGIGTHTVVGIGGGKAIRNNLSLNGEFSYIPLGSNSIDVLGAQSSYSAKSLTFDFGGQYQFKHIGKFDPYAGIGVGWVHTSSSSSVNVSVAGYNVSGASSANNAFIKFGGGGRYYLGNNWGVKPELMVFAGSNTFARLSGGLFYMFGK